jgi:hypothetical protein
MTEKYVGLVIGAGIGAGIFYWLTSQVEAQAGRS